MPLLHDNVYFSPADGNIPKTAIPEAHPVSVNPQFRNPKVNDYSMPESGAVHQVSRFAVRALDAGLRPTNTLATFNPGGVGNASPCGSWILPTAGQIQIVTAHTIAANSG